jgi:ankyrin repeat protein
MVCLILENDEEISLEHEEAILSTALSKKLKDIVDIILQKKVRKGVLLNLLEDEDGQLIVKKGMTLLEWVIKNGYLKTLKVLLEKGADINDQSEWYKQTPLHYAVDKGDIKMVKLLLDHGPNTTLKTNMGKTALDLAETDEMKKLLHDHHAQSKSSITIGTTEHKDGY